MARSGRSRTRTLAPPVGYAESKFDGALQAHNTNTGYLSEDFCADFHGRPLTDGSVTIEHTRRDSIIPFDGDLSVPFNGHTYVSTIRNYSRPMEDNPPSHLALVLPTDDAAVTDAIARTNPSRPSLIPLEYLQDLKDIPKLLRDVERIRNRKLALNLTPKELANQNLLFQFGLLPLIDDVQRLLHFQHYANKRLEELNKLYSPLGLRRSIRVGKASNHMTRSNVTTGLGYATVSCKRETITRGEKWVTVRWKPTVIPAWSKSDEGRIRKAREVASGLTPEGISQGLWELLPWSFIVDWFTNLGDFAILHSNTVPAQSGSYNVMQHTLTTDTYRVDSFANTVFSAGAAAAIRGGGGTVTLETKRRACPTHVSLSAFLPFLGDNRLSILGSLFVQRFK